LIQSITPSFDVSAVCLSVYDIATVGLEVVSFWRRRRRRRK